MRARGSKITDIVLVAAADDGVNPQITKPLNIAASSITVAIKCDLPEKIFQNKEWNDEIWINSWRFKRWYTFVEVSALKTNLDKLKETSTAIWDILKHHIVICKGVVIE